MKEFVFVWVFLSFSVAQGESANFKAKHIIRIGVQGAAFDKGQPKYGVADGPKTCRASGFIQILRDEIGHDVKDYGDIPLVDSISDPSQQKPESSTDQPKDALKRLKNPDLVGAACKMISDATARILRDGRVVLTLGGDHAISIGTVSGVTQVYDDVAVLYVDAHGDINTPHTSHSGNMHGMPMAFLIKQMKPYMVKLPAFSWLTPKISAKNVAFIGQRDVDDGEKAIYDELGIKVFSMRDVDNYGIRDVVKLALDRISPGNIRPLHLSIDIDTLDPLEVVTTGTIVSGGFGLREMITLVEAIHEAGNLVSIELTEVNPALGNEADVRRTMSAIKHILINAFGYNRGGNAKGEIPRP